MVAELRRIGVDEIACLIDFGVDTDSVLASLHFLEQLNRNANQAADIVSKDYSIAGQIRRHQVTHLQCTPSLARMLVSDPDGAAALGSLQELLVGGEALPAALAAQLGRTVNGRIHNMYGPTETAVWSTTQLIPATGDVTIGRPLANTEIYLLDKYGQPVPIGLPGELLIGGEGVARGYLNRPELTSQKFVPHPFRPDSGDLLYRTGDLARYREDGSIEFLGRIDHQVKLRGHRIELGEIESVLNAHPAVKESVVVAADDSQGEKRLVAYVVPGQKSAGEASSCHSRNVDGSLEQWQAIWDGTYGGNSSESDPAFNIVGWTSSYTGQPMPEVEMREWVECTADRILAWRPKRVMEIGCGTGLLLFRIVPHCKQYLATDFSVKALDHLRQHLAQHALPQVTLFQKMADDFMDVEPGSMDLIILNSVIQYFPDMDYLVRVLEGAAMALAPGGRLFIGDVRSLPLLESFHASVELAQAPPELTRAQFRQQVRKRLAREEELVIDPAFFHALREHLPGLTRTEIHLKPGRFHNEITRFRYNVVLRAGEPTDVPTEILWTELSAADLTDAEIKRLLPDNGSNFTGIARIPNARLSAENKVLHWMTGDDGPETVGKFRRQLSAAGKNSIDPERVRELARAAGCAADILWPADANTSGAFDVIFRRGDVSAAFVSSSQPWIRRRKPWSEYANQPVRGQSDARFITPLRAHLKQRLPEIMVPSAFVVLPAMPLTPNGKVDRRRLPAPDPVRQEIATSSTPPKTPVEIALAGLWREILGLETVGVNDDFFKSGGHSLLATQLVSRLREVFKIELSLRALFEAPTIARLAQRLIAQESKPGAAEKIARILNRAGRHDRRRIGAGTATTPVREPAEPFQLLTKQQDDSMKTLLRQPRTGLYLKGAGKWTPDCEKARDFKSSVTARSYCENHHILHAQIVLKFDTEQYDIVLPVHFYQFERGLSGHMSGI